LTTSHFLRSKTDVLSARFSRFVCISFENIYTFHVGGAMRTNIVIDNRLMQRAMKATGLSTKKAVVEEGLRLLIKVKGQEGIRRLRGKIEWEGDLGAMREGRIKAAS
jgi:Arc/MetJ family transcription regulator